MEESIIYQFVAAINSHSVEQISDLMTENHSFIDAHNNKVTGRQNMAEGWKAYFNWFPDYKIEVEQIIQGRHAFAIFGYAEGTYQNLKNENEKAHWRLPAAWKATIINDRIAVWQVYADSMIPFEIIRRYAPGEATDKVSGIGGVFFKSDNPKVLCAWYDEHLGTNFGNNEYTVFPWRERDNKERIGSTTFSAFKASSDYFNPSTKGFMFNLRVGNLEAMLERLKKEGVQVFDKVENYDYGKFGWILDPEGNKIELWEPKNEELFDVIE